MLFGEVMLCKFRLLKWEQFPSQEWKICRNCIFFVIVL